MDFTVKKYKQLLQAIKTSGYTIQNIASFMENPADHVIVLRHDVDRLPANALLMAMLEHTLETKASYYFRVVPESFDEKIMAQIRDLDHEIGFHYEDLAIAKGNPEKAIQHFEQELERFRGIYPVKTICMHGSPLSRYDNRDLWKHYDYRDFGIVGEPYFDVDFNEVFYISDTGRKWNKESASVRDRVESGFDVPIKNTAHLIALIEKGALPDKIMINVHPHRWFDFGVGWVKELVGQNIKNIVKRGIVRLRK